LTGICVRTVLTILGVAIAAWAGLVAILFLFQRSLLFLPDRTAPESRALLAAGFAPLSIGDRGMALTGWFRRAAPGQLTVVLFHGNAGHLGYRLPSVLPLSQQGFGVVLAPYLGYGNSPGSPSEQAFYESGRATLKALQAEGIESRRTVLWGESLGSGMATQLATEERVAGVILQAPFTSVAARATEIYPFVPAYWLVRDRFDNLSRIARIRAPLLIVHGTDDRVVPTAHGRRLLDAAAEPKHGVFIPGAGHNDLDQYGLHRAMLEFLEKLRSGN
jgi:uncharacterized protein